MRPNIAIVALLLEVVWLAIAITAYQSELADNIDSTAVTLAAIAIIWASPAIALCVIAWLVDQGLRMRALPPPRPAASPPPPPPPITPQAG
jgi:hypothetical protein